ncbi:MAG TPA: MarR family transcriptional regulator [Anaerolineaceae bacterium]|nr:MarR family transcriptional regulator [Anaerolineaceae bacterium]
MVSEEADNSADSPVPPIFGGHPALSRFIENMGLQYEEYGVPRIGGRILGVLLVTPHPVPAEELSQSLQVSRSSISTNLRTLMLAGLVERTFVPGDRREHFIFSDSAWQRSLDMRLDGVTELRSVAVTGLQELAGNHPARSRLEEMVHWADLLHEAYQHVRIELQSRKEVPA